MSTASIIQSRAATPASVASHPVISVLRLHLSGRGALFGVPWLVMGIIFIVNYAIWLILGSALTGPDRADALAGTQYSGASFYVFVYMMIVGIMAISATFPFALGYSVTRRSFYLGTALLFVLLSVGYGIAFTLLAVIERATDGWGVGGRLFTAIWFGEGDPLTALVVFVGGLLFFFFVGAALATIYTRWRGAGMIILFAGLGLILIVAAAVFTWTSSWLSVGQWFAAAGPLGVVGALSVITVISAVVGYLGLRRATPRT